MNSWVLAAIAVVAGVMIGLIASRIVFSVVGGPGRPEAIRSVARPLAQLALAIGVVMGLITGLGFVQPSALEQLPKDVVSFVPKLMVAAIIVILANVLASFATTALDRTTGRMPLHVQRQANLIVKGTIVALAVLLAISQLGIDTEIINLAVAAIFFGLAASFTLLVGLGGQGVAREVAASRALRRMIEVGDTVSISNVEGTVKALHPTAIEMIDGEGKSILVPSSNFLNHNISVKRTPSKAAADHAGNTAGDSAFEGAVSPTQP